MPYFQVAGNNSGGKKGFKGKKRGRGINEPNSIDFHNRTNVCTALLGKKRGTSEKRKKGGKREDTQSSYPRPTPDSKPARAEKKGRKRRGEKSK